jgi:tetratricopeptide (TPR) repeat protein
MVKTAKIQWLLPFSLVLTSGVQWGCARTPQQREARFLARGKQELLSKDYSKAVLDFRNAVAIAPNDAEAYYQLGWSLLQQGRLRDAAAAMRKAIELNPRHTGAQVKLAELLVLAGDEDSAKQSKERMKDILSDSPDNPDALTALALAELRFGDLKEGEQHLRQALAKAPQNLQSSMILARVKLEIHDYDAAEQVLKEAVRSNPASVEGALGLAWFYRARERWTDAEAQFRNVLKIDQKNAMALDGLATVLFQKGQKDQAEQFYRQAAALPDKHYKHHHAAYLFQEGQRDAAIAEFATLVKQDPKDRDARSRLISAYLLADRQADAEKVLASALKSNPKDTDALLQRAQILVRTGKADDSKKDLIQVLQYQPNTPMAHYLLAKADQANGQTQQRRQELDEALRLQPDLLGVRIELAQALLESNQPKAALDIMNGTPPDQKNMLPYLVQRNWALLAIGDLTELSKAIKQGLTAAKAPDLLLQAGLLELQRRNYSGARSYLAEALERNPEDLRALEALARSYAEEGQVSVAFQKVREHVTRNPKSAQMQIYLGTQLQISGDLVGARNAYEAAESADPASVRAKLALAQLDLREGHLDEARKRASAVASGSKDVVPARLMLGDIEANAGNHAAAIEQYRKVLGSAPESVRALNGIAYQLAEYQRLPDEALKFAEKAAEIAPDDDAVKDTIGWVLYRKGVYKTAVHHLRSAAANNNLVVAKYHLAMAYLKAGQSDLGEQTLKAALRIDPALPEAVEAKQILAEAKRVAEK